MAPFTHVGPERPSRFGAGAYGVLYAARAFETAVLETIHHHTQTLFKLDVFLIILHKSGRQVRY